MNKDGHCIVAFYFIVISFGIGLNALFASQLQLYLFMVSFAFFSTQLNPDIDLKIPYLPHRGATHDLRGIVAMATIIGFTGWYLLGSISPEWSFFPPIMIGMAMAWILHSGVDFMHDKIKDFSWILVAIALVMTFIYLKR